MLLENDICFRVAEAMLFVFRLQGHDRFIVDIDSTSYSVQTTWKTLTVYLGLSPCPVTATTRIIRFLVGDTYKPSFPTVPWKGVNSTYIELPVVPWFSESSDLSSCISWENRLLFLCRSLSCISNLSKFSPPQKKRMSSSKQNVILDPQNSRFFLLGVQNFQPFAASAKMQHKSSRSHLLGRASGKGRELVEVCHPKNIFSDWKSEEKGWKFKRYLKAPPSQLYYTQIRW